MLLAALFIMTPLWETAPISTSIWWMGKSPGAYAYKETLVGDKKEQTLDIQART
jgi:hypothetical protein